MYGRAGLELLKRKVLFPSFLMLSHQICESPLLV